MCGKLDNGACRNSWHKQEAFKGRNVVYGSGWAGWGFESNVTAQAVNAASPETLRDFPIFEHDPMFSAAITTNMQNRILAKGIPALSRATGIEGSLSLSSNWDAEAHCFRMKPPDGKTWCRSSNTWEDRWLHTDIHNLALFFTCEVFEEFVRRGNLRE